MTDPPNGQDQKKPRDPGGRPSKWNPGMVEEAFLYCLEHHGTDRDLAAYLGIGYSTLYYYIDRHPALLDAIKRGRRLWRQNGCGNVVRSLYRKAERQEVRVPKIRIKKVWDEKQGKMVIVERTVTMETHILWPEQRAIEYILANQDPENWKFRPDGIGVEDPMAYAEKVREALREFDEMHKEAEPEKQPDGEPERPTDTGTEQ
jgi:hypothetical protein